VRSASLSGERVIGVGAHLLGVGRKA
jgi:hypothetical protein